MKLRIITIGSPRLAYAKLGWEEYYNRLGHYHKLEAIHIADKNSSSVRILDAAANSYIVALNSGGEFWSSRQLASWLNKRALVSKDVSFIIGGPEGLHAAVLAAADHSWSLSPLIFPHDLAMVILLESLYRASTINAGLPYHK